MAQSTIPVKQLPVVTTVGSPGSDASIPTEQAVRESLSSNQSSTAAKLFLYSTCA